MPVCTTACYLLDCVSYHYISLFYITYICYISVLSLTLTKHITATPSHPYILSPKNTGTTALLHLHQHRMKPWYCVALSSHIRRTIIEDITILQSTKWVSITIHITNYICTINYFRLLVLYGFIQTPKFLSCTLPSLPTRKGASLFTLDILHDQMASSHSVMTVTYLIVLVLVVCVEVVVFSIFLSVDFVQL